MQDLIQPAGMEDGKSIWTDSVTAGANCCGHDELLTCCLPHACTTNSGCAGPALRHQVGTATGRHDSGWGGHDNQLHLCCPSPMASGIGMASSQLSLYGGGILVTDAFTVKFDRKTGENNLWQKRGVN